MAGQGMERLTYGGEFEGSKVVINLMASRSMNFHSSAPPDVAAAPVREVFA